MLMPAATMWIQYRFYGKILLKAGVHDLDVLALPFLEDFDLGWFSAHEHIPNVRFFGSVAKFNVLSVDSSVAKVY